MLLSFKPLHNIGEGRTTGFGLTYRESDDKNKTYRTMVYVLDKDGRPLMPTTRHGMVRHLLRDRRAVCVRRTPFTIRLLGETTTYIQDVTLGVDAGSKTVGLSATTKTKDLYRSEITLRNDIVSNLSTRREARRTRRNRKTRYRAVRFDNRRRRDGWIAPSIEQKINSHIRAIDLVCSILPVKTIVVEVAQFDTQLLKNPDISGVEYQQGEQLGFWNVREYVLFRDGHQCQHCHGSSKDKILNVHHLESRKTGGDSPSNLITLCETCHKAYHKGKFELKVKRTSPSLRDAAFMSVVRWHVYKRLKEAHPNKEVKLTYGYLTKKKRIDNGIEKTHCADAFCIAGNLQAERLDSLVLGRCVARHSRSLHVMKPAKGGDRRSAVASHWITVKRKNKPSINTRLQRFDTVKYECKTCVISGSTNGRPILKNSEWKQATASNAVNHKTVAFLSRKHGSIIYQHFGK